MSCRFVAIIPNQCQEWERKYYKYSAATKILCIISKSFQHDDCLEEGPSWKGQRGAGVSDNGCLRNIYYDPGLAAQNATGVSDRINIENPNPMFGYMHGSFRMRFYPFTVGV